MVKLDVRQQDIQIVAIYQPEQNARRDLYQSLGLGDFLSKHVGVRWLTRSRARGVKSE
jgi:hypothetical protein